MSPAKKDTSKDNDTDTKSTSTSSDDQSEKSPSEQVNTTDTASTADARVTGYDPHARPGENTTEPEYKYGDKRADGEIEGQTVNVDQYQQPGEGGEGKVGDRKEDQA